MNVEYAFLCDYADATTKLTAVGIGMDTIYAQSVPAIHSQMYAVLVIRFTANEAGRAKEYQMRVQDADGADIIPPLIDSVQIPSAPKGALSLTHSFVNGLYGTTFENYNSYQVSWLIDGTEVQTIPFQVVPPQ